MLKPIIVCALTAATAAAAPTTTPVTLDETVPVSLISQAALRHHALAEVLFQGLPAAQQDTLIHAGAIGQVAPSTDGLGILALDADAAQPISIEQAEARFGLTFSSAHRKLFERFQAAADRGEPVPAVCLSPDTDPKLAEALLLIIDGITAGGPDRYYADGRWTTTATDGSGLLKGQAITITWSMVPDGTSADGQVSDLFAWLDSVYTVNGGRTEWQLRVRQTFSRWGFLCGINYVEVSDDGATVSSGNTGALGSRGDVRICGIPIDGNSNILAYNYFPNFGDMFLDSTDNFFDSFSQSSRRLKNVISHEHGHGMGLAHVEPVDQTKLMEPFASTAFIGPRIDDRLGAQRNYGDALEDNDSAATAYDIGAINDGDTYTRKDLSTDDNSDIDYYEFSVPDSGVVTVSLTLAAGEYLMGRQGGTPNLINYNNAHDLHVEIRDNTDLLVGTIDNTGLGEDEVGNVAIPAGGTYYVRVSPNNTTNNVQLYDMLIGFDHSASSCLVDLNNDGFLDSADISVFVSLFLTSNPAADFNLDGFIDNGDIGVFITLFLAGCP